MEDLNTLPTKEVNKTRSHRKEIVIIFILFFAVGLYMIDKSINDYNARKNVNDIDLQAFTNCIASQNTTMYGTSWCHYCSQQKDMLSPYFDKINFVDCDANQTQCLSMGIEGYPTWIINGKKYVGIQNLEKLSSITGCELK